jgi:hypothetical protein
MEKKVGVKYCGGCNPSYERVKMIYQVQSQLKNQFLFLRHDEPGIEAMIFVSGCPRACACRDMNPKGIPHCSVTGENDFENLMNWLASLNEKGDF